MAAYVLSTVEWSHERHEQYCISALLLNSPKQSCVARVAHRSWQIFEHSVERWFNYHMYKIIGWSHGLAWSTRASMIHQSSHDPPWAHMISHELTWSHHELTWSPMSSHDPIMSSHDPTMSSHDHTMSWHDPPWGYTRLTWALDTLLGEPPQRVVALRTRSRLVSTPLLKFMLLWF